MGKHYLHLRAQDGTVVRLRAGFSWAACLFGPLWALVNRAWVLFGMMALSFAALVLVDEMVVKPSHNLILAIAMLAAYIAYMAICGTQGNAWLLKTFLQKGYEQVDKKD